MSVAMSKFRKGLVLSLVLSVGLTCFGCSLLDNSKASSPTAKSITSFAITSPVAATGTINQDYTINVGVLDGTAVTAMVAAFEYEGVSVSVGGVNQASGVTANDFTNPQTYTVTAEDGSTQDYVVTVYFNTITSTWGNPASGYSSYLLDAPENSEFLYNINLGSSTKDVYFIFTNTSLSSAVTAPVTLANTAPSFLSSVARSFSISQKSSAEPVAQRGTPEITEFNRDPFGHLGISKNAYSRNVMIRPEPPLYDTVGGTMSFMNESTSDLIPSTCRKAVTVDGYTMYIYVADDCWTGGTKANLVTQAMVDAVAGKFLVSGNADIFHWVRNVFGAHWGAHSYSNMIGATTDITILLYDIDGDNSTTGGTCGFFWSKDLFNTTSVSYSNQRAMFYIDAVMLATKEDATWEISDYWPSQMISTLAHEFQHMIHFYQKAIVRAGGTNSESWINEMCSMSAEDLVADKIQVDGPRAVAYTDSTAGSSGIVSGRVSMFNYYPEYPVASWDTGSNVLFDYAIKYVLGAYYGRNYGGAAFFQNIIQNSYTDYRAIEWALTQAGSSDTFTASLRKWFVSVLLSDKTDTAAGYGYNKAGWFTSTLNAITYNLGSMNFFNYYQHDGSAAGNLGVYVNTGVVDLNPSSSFIYKAGTGVTGAQSWPVTLKPGIKMTVVVK